MNAKQLIEFLGHSSKHRPFDDFLLSNGIKKRPKGEELTVWLKDKPKGISMEFSFSESYDKEVLRPKKSDGQFILQAVTFEKEPESGLPYGLTFKRTQTQTDQLIGPPKGEVDATFSTYFYDEKVIAIRWKDGDSGIMFVTFRYPNIYDKKNLGI